MSPAAEVSVEKFQHEVVESGLHRLAQPLTAALWTLEAAPGKPSAPLTAVEEQVRRAIGVLRMVRSLLNAIQPFQDAQPEDLRLLLSAVRDTVLRHHSAVRLTLVLDGEAAVEPHFVPGEAFRTALMLLIEDFLRMGLPSPGIHLTLTTEENSWGGTSLLLAIVLHSPALSSFGERELRALIHRVQPLEDSSFDFAGGALPGAALGQAIFASIGISLEAAMHSDTLHYRLCLKPSSKYPDDSRTGGNELEVLQ
jgi:signal transduction histidine kinase